MTNPLKDNIQEVLVTSEQIKAKAKELGAQIAKDYEGKDLLIICVLKGALPFMADLIREIDHPLAIDFMAVSSYGDATTSSGAVMILKDLETNINGRNVLIVEDIIDTGLTLKYLIENLQARKPASLKICTLLDKPERRKVDIRVDYKGFTIPDAFVVGYGLDFAELYRNLPDVCILKPEAYENN
ncbi:hypoxanthine phosphoribosyltransferase [Zhaonella formicivorans]|uniref:hypoxanthine phosphoribosyltransferase n=1 Tax=Zhaonella formicivorans TaxID=2528593 RepID=UPI0010DEFA48|nr:hypoxanthine phosphoribosyltransferase [Zhaonella formicivorans]